MAAAARKRKYPVAGVEVPVGTGGAGAVALRWDISRTRSLKLTRRRPMISPGAAMSSIASIALSGLNAASSQLATAAHNIANAQTPGFRQQLMQQTAQPDGGVVVSIGQATDAGDSLAEDVVTQVSATYAFKANVLTLKTQGRMLGSLLDLKA
jgi:hypothetical protein